VDFVEQAGPLGLGSSLHLDSYSDACPSVIQSHESRRNVKYYECCPDEPYVDITVELMLAWR